MARKRSKSRRRPAVTRRATTVVYRNKRRSRRLSAGPGPGIKGALNLALKAGVGGIAAGMLVGLIPEVSANPQHNAAIKGAIIIAGAALVATKMKQPIIGAGMAAVGAPVVLSAFLPAGSVPGLSQGAGQWIQPLSSGRYLNY